MHRGCHSDPFARLLLHRHIGLGGRIGADQDGGQMRCYAPRQQGSHLLRDLGANGSGGRRPVQKNGAFRLLTGHACSLSSNPCSSSSSSRSPISGKSNGASDASDSSSCAASVGGSLSPTCCANAPSTPLTKRPDSAVLYFFANSTASLMETLVGTPGRNSISKPARRRILRSTATCRSSFHPEANPLTARFTSLEWASTPWTNFTVKVATRSQSPICFCTICPTLSQRA